MSQASVEGIPVSESKALKPKTVALCIGENNDLRRIWVASLTDFSQDLKSGLPEWTVLRLPAFVWGFSPTNPEQKPSEATMRTLLKGSCKKPLSLVRSFLATPNTKTASDLFKS